MLLVLHACFKLEKLNAVRVTLVGLLLLHFCVAWLLVGQYGSGLSLDRFVKVAAEGPQAGAVSELEQCLCRVHVNGLILVRDFPE